MTVPSVAPRAGAAWVAALALLSSFGPLCLDMYLPALPDLPAELGSTATMAQLTLSACIVGLGVGQLIAGPWSDRVGRRLPLLVGLLLFVLSSALCAVTTSLELLVALRILQGAAGAVGIVVGRAVVADRFSGPAAASYFAIIASINGLSPILAPVIGGQILAVGTWRTVFWVLAGFGLLLAVLTRFAVPESLPVERRIRRGRAGIAGDGGTPGGSAFRTLLTDRGYVGVVVAGSMVAAAMFGYISASPFLLRTGFGLSPQVFSICFAGNAIGIVITTQLGRRLLVRTSAATVLTVGVGQAIVGAVALLVVTLTGAGLVAVLVALFVMVSAVGFALPFSAAIAMDRHRRIAGTASALIGLAQYAFGALTAPLVGLGDRTTGVALGVTAVAASALAAAGLLLARPVLRTRPER